MSDHNGVVKPLFDQALEAIKETAPHFVPVTNECVCIYHGRPVGHAIWVNPEVNNDADLKERVSRAQEYRDDHVKFCLSHIDEIVVDDKDVLIVIIGIVPMNESVAPDWDENTPESVRKNDTRLILDAHCFVRSAFESALE